jgi:hypothetical protein
VDASEAVVKKLRGKNGGANMPVAIGDFATLNIEGRFSLVYVESSIPAPLCSQEDQIRCFSSVARRLREEGVFVIGSFVPDMTRRDRDRRIEPSRERR